MLHFWEQWFVKDFIDVFADILETQRLTSDMGVACVKTVLILFKEDGL